MTSVDPGLCATCTHGRRIESTKGSVFWRCLHPQLPKYPRLPVLTCPSHHPST